MLGSAMGDQAVIAAAHGIAISMVYTSRLDC